MLQFMYKGGVNMNIDDTVKYINEELTKGRTFKNIETELGFNDRVLYKRLIRKGYKRSDEGYKLFILTGNTNNSSFNKYNMKAEKDIIPEAKTNNKIITKVDKLSDQDIQRLKGLLSRYNDIMCMLDGNTIYTQHIHNTDDIQIIQTTNTKQKMFRVDSDVLDKWSEFCKEYKHIKVQSLISSALLEYIEKYSK